MKLFYHGLNVFLLPIAAIYICYINIQQDQWETSLLLALLSIFSIGNYLQTFGEPDNRAEEQDYQDQFINQALNRCEVLEYEVGQLKREIEELT